MAVEAWPHCDEVNTMLFFLNCLVARRYSWAERQTVKKLNIMLLLPELQIEGSDFNINIQNVKELHIKSHVRVHRRTVSSRRF